MANKIGKGHGKHACSCGYSTSNNGQWKKHAEKCGHLRTYAREKKYSSYQPTRAKKSKAA